MRLAISITGKMKSSYPKALQSMSPLLRIGTGPNLFLSDWPGDGNVEGPRITLDDRERAVKENKKLKFIGQDKIKATTQWLSLRRSEDQRLKQKPAPRKNS